MVQVSPGKYTVYAVSWDGRLHQINLGDGENVAPPEKFIPGNGKPYALNYKDGVVYTATAQGCGGLTKRLPLLRSRVTPRQHVHSGGRRLVGPPWRSDRLPRARLPRNGRRHFRSGKPAPRQRYRRCEDRREEAASAGRLFRHAECELDVAT
jgi:hypothetical protein